MKKSETPLNLMKPETPLNLMKSAVVRRTTAPGADETPEASDLAKRDRMSYVRGLAARRGGGGGGCLAPDDALTVARDPAVG